MADLPWPLTLLSQLVSNLPPPLPTLLSPFIRSLAPVINLLSTSPSEWTTTSVAMSLMTLYLTLRSLRQTWGWITWLIRWGLPLMLVALGVGIGMYPEAGARAGGWVLNQAVQNVIHPGPGAARAHVTTPPRVWDSFRDHQNYRDQQTRQQKQQQQADPGSLSDTLTRVMNSIERGAWMEAAKDVADAFSGSITAGQTRQTSQEEEGMGNEMRGKRQQPKRKTKARGKTRYR